MLLAVPLVGCSAENGSPEAVPASSSASEPASATGAKALLAEHGWDGANTVEIIDRLDRLGGSERPREMIASVRSDELVVSAGDDELSLRIPEDRFYLAVAPYVDRTHDCVHHSLTTCAGELAEAEIQVQVVDETNDDVLVEETRTTFANGFTGFWLPRDIEGTLRVGYRGRSGVAAFTTNEDAPTCLTTLQLV